LTDFPGVYIHFGMSELGVSPQVEGLDRNWERRRSRLPSAGCGDFDVFRLHIVIDAQIVKQARETL
jgi:hypothetical protein